MIVLYVYDGGSGRVSVTGEDKNAREWLDEHGEALMVGMRMTLMHRLHKQLSPTLLKSIARDMNAWLDDYGLRSQTTVIAARKVIRATASGFVPL